jgi:ectoine hydroxylase-related dioxygenase (phytanoyl-CoA dioxygenase family)
MIKTLSLNDSMWLQSGIKLLNHDGVFVLDKVLNPAVCDRLISAAEDAYAQLASEIGLDRLQRAGESGVVRFPLKFHDDFSILLGNPQVFDCISQFVSPFAICHLMNAILLKPADNTQMSASPLFQSTFHRDFPRYTGHVPLSLNSFYCLTDFSETNGSTQFKLGSHRQNRPDISSVVSETVSVGAAAGSVIFFDSTIWHAGGTNLTSSVRAGVNVQWTHHWIKQQIDLVRYLGIEKCKQFTPEIQRRLGVESRVVTSLKEYYVPQEDRIYKGGQG